MAEAESDGGVARPRSRVLHVDDDELELIALRRAFRRLLPHWQVETAASGAEALDRVAVEAPFTAIIADINMPGMGGLEMITRMRALDATAGVPIVVFTSSNLERDRNDAVTCGASAYFVKDMNEAVYRRLAAWVSTGARTTPRA